MHELATTWLEVVQLHAAYAAAIDAGRFGEWPGFFTEDGEYRLVPRENHERGLPLATLAFDSRAGMLDRVYGIKETLFHDPYYQRHVVGAPVLLRAAPERIECEAHYAVFRTKLDQPTTVFNVGRYLDTIVRTAEGLKFRSRVVVYDSELIPNSIIYPI